MGWFLRFNTFLMKKILFLLCLSFFCNSSFAQKEFLQSGPMLGYSDYREALIWVQTNQTAKVKIAYWGADNKKKFTEEIATQKNDDFSVKLLADDVEFGNKYTYEVYINNQLLKFDYPLTFQILPLWQYRTDPPEINFALGSCVYVNETSNDRPGRPYGDKYEVFNSILAKKPDFMMWLGDNVYLREPDFGTRNGIFHRYRHTRSLKEMQPLLASVHNYAIWDDHDYGPNDSDASYVNKKISEEAFNKYWGNPNTNVVGNGGVTGMFQWGDIEFFLLDNRYHRSSNSQVTPNRAYLGKEQLDWLIQALTASRAPFKFVCLGGQVINSAEVFENYATYPEERDELLKRIQDEKIEGVIFFSGDRHHTEISKMEREGAYPLYDITCSSITSGSHKPDAEDNKYQVANTTYYDRNFGMMTISGKRLDRKLKLTIYDTKGVKIFDYSIQAKDLRLPK